MGVWLSGWLDGARCSVKISEGGKEQVGNLVVGGRSKLGVRGGASPSLPSQRLEPSRHALAR